MAWEGQEAWPGQVVKVGVVKQVLLSGHQATRKLVGCVCVCRQVEGRGLCVQTTPGLLECRQVSCEAHVWHQRMNSGSYLINGSKNLLIIWFSAPQ